MPDICDKRQGLSSGAASKLANWFLSDDRGKSSLILAATGLTGRAPREAYAPLTPVGFVRCMRLVEAVPELRTAAFPLLHAENPQWAYVIDNWDALADIARQECGSSSTEPVQSPRLYEALSKALVHTT